ncbi:DUF1501 domain-containing protein [Scleromatobacter humisilvae]|uniref:DUF1501 domain-containing protein n=1 Tax=Scleromatobacter humisilvae TaxID=2897159 RepID=A0A9X1YP87_9BURK|nr:DUF1501 domain-containing protein [Scleromatobacter humisilvae]MCK9689502.1 DUF1501 domain-containing protein [Scleromatobacter humisilvae]
MQRRHFLNAAMAGLAMNATRTWAAPAGSTVDSRLLVVFLRGAYDACNVLIPQTSFYAESRPNIAIARPGVGANAALAFDADWALMPALQSTLYPRIQAGEVAFIPFAGIGDLSRSHFETQDRVELGLPLPGDALAPGTPRPDTTQGFLNRLAQELGARLDSDQRVMSFTDRLPTVLQGRRMVTNTSLARTAKPATDARQAALLQKMYAGTTLERGVAEGLDTQKQVALEMADEMQRASRDAVTPKGFELEATRIARLMRDQVRIGFVDVGGWDTHVGQGGATGALATRIGDLSRGLDAFAREMGPAWRDTVVVVISEFGRTFKENGNRGTDHGHGTAYWVMGGGVKGGVRGEQVALTSPASLNQGRDWPVLNDYRGVFGGLFQRMYGLDAEQLQRVFPGGAPRDIGLV